MQPSGKLTLNRNPANFFAETEQVAFHTGHVVPGHRVHQRPAAPGAAVLLPRHADDPARRPELHADPDQPAARAGQRQPPRRLQQQAVPPASRRTCRTRSTAACPFTPAPDDGGTSTCRAGREARRSRDEPVVVRRPLQPGDACSRSMCRGREDHIVDAYTFELGKCYEQAIKESMLTVLARSTPSCARRWPPGSACRCRTASPATTCRAVARALADAGRAVADRRPRGRRDRRARTPTCPGSTTCARL